MLIGVFYSSVDPTTSNVTFHLSAFYYFLRPDKKAYCTAVLQSVYGIQTAVDNWSLLFPLSTLLRIILYLCYLYAEVISNISESKINPVKQTFVSFVKMVIKTASLRLT